MTVPIDALEGERSAHLALTSVAHSPFWSPSRWQRGLLTLKAKARWGGVPGLVRKLFTSHPTPFSYHY